MSISAGFAAVYGLLLAFLAVYVSMGRLKFKIPLGNGDNEEFQRRRRAHGNAIEHAVIMIPLVMLYEMRNGSIEFLVAISFLFLLLRIFHAAALITSAVSTTRRYTSVFCYLIEVTLALALLSTLTR